MAEPANTLPADSLRESLDAAFQDPAFRWRIPMQDAGEYLSDKAAPGWLRSLVKAVEDFFDWLVRWMPDAPTPGDGGGGGGFNVAGAILWLALILIVVALIIAGLAYARSSRRRHLATAEAAAGPQLDLNREDIMATQLPEDEWLALAARHRLAGEYRLAARAVFLGGLARLAGRGYLKVNRCKTNLDYDRELARAGRASPLLLQAYRGSLDRFEQVWYGRHPADEETCSVMEGLLARLREASA